ncbi:hypothetical protein DTO164E3_8653 [Paecilomyces variotii]|nr:hypothetical protein DTO164E3_8653 [Paecilomyces variotii]KAJ9348436.1 hypothetical protein DTO280E4_9326 [Paecilomyces variotii]KAJ9403175.1 hypothetical protein DTO045G8_9090 [Paecilomyces variotii]
MPFFGSKNGHHVANSHENSKKSHKKSLSWWKTRGLQETSGIDNNQKASLSCLSTGGTEGESTGALEGRAISPALREADSIWSRAYDSLKAKDPVLVNRYEEILSKEYTSDGRSEDNSTNIIAQNDPQRRQLQMDEMMKKGQQRMEENKIRSRISKGHDITCAANAVLATTDWVGEALSNSREASLIWAGVSLVVQIFTNTITASDANLEGFQYVTARLGFYNEFQTRWIPRISDGLRKSFERSVQDLYESILEFQLRSVLRLYRSSIRNFGGDLFQPRRWDELLSRVKERERIVTRDSVQIRDSALYDIQEKVLKLSIETAERKMTRNERDCLQLFRLTHTTGSGAELEQKLTYEDFKYRVEYRVGGTCQWFLDQENFKHWLKDDSGILLVTADPGCGKSVLAKYLIDCELPQCINESGKPPVICYFFFKEQVQSRVHIALCALLHQLLSQRPSLVRHAIEAVEKNGPKLIEIPGKLWEILQNATRDEDAGQVIFVLDALDECDRYDRQKLISFLKSQFLRASTASGKLKILLTSRPYGDITHEFDEAFPNMRIPGEDESPRIADEINAVIRYRVRKFQQKRGLTEGAANYLEKRLMEIKHRTYLWLYLVFDYLENELIKLTEKEMQKKVFSNIPVSFDDAYEKILEKSKDKERALKIFKILLTAYRPLTAGEMQIALETDRSSSSLRDLDLEPVGEFQRSLRQYCGLFVSIDDGMVYFLHQTAREYLLPKIGSATSNSTTDVNSSAFRHSISTQQAHALLAGCCMAYVKFPHWLEESQPDNRDLSIPGSPDQITHERSFLIYASAYWAIHLQQAEDVADQSMQGDALELCQIQTTRLYPWFDTHWEQIQTGRLEKPASAIAISSYFGLEVVVQQLLIKNGIDKGYIDDFDKSSLLWAAERGHEAVVKLLLQTGKADLNLKDPEFGMTPIAYAAENGHKEIAELLLGTGQVDPDSVSKEGWRPLSYACKNGHEAIVKMLLETGRVDPESVTEDRYGVTPLLVAAATGHDAVVKLLLRTAKVDPNPRSAEDDTPLIHAAYEGHQAVVKLLLETDGIDTESKGPFGWPPLQTAAWNRQPEMVKLLIESGKVDPELKDNSGWTALHTAAHNGRLEVVKALLETGKVNMKSETDDGRTALSLAADNGTQAVVKLLLETGEYDPNHNNKYGRTPLMEAARSGHDEAVKLLLETGKVDPDSKDIYGQTPLRYAAERGRPRVVKLLLETGKVDPMSTANDGDSPLSAAIREQHEAIVELLQSYIARQLQ